MDDIAAAPVFRDDDAARALLEELRWPKGVVCVRNPDHMGALKIGGSKRSHRKGLYVCPACRTERPSAQYTVTVGTMFERTRVPLRHWMHALYLWSIDGEPVIQDVQSSTGVTYKTAWLMWERVHAAARLYKGQLRAFGTGVRNVMREKQSKAVARGLFRYEADKLRAKGVHPSQHTIRATGILSSSASALALRDKTTRPALDRTEALVRLMLATDPSALDKFKRHKRRKIGRGS